MSPAPTARSLAPPLALCHLLKSNIGPGMLSLPHTFSLLPNSVLVPVFLAIFLLTSLNSALLAALAARAFPPPETATYTKLGERAFGRGGRRLVQVSVILQQLSVCTVYFTFIATNLSMVDPLWPSSVTSSAARSKIVMVLSYPLIMAGVLLTRHLTTLNVINSVATAMLFVSIAVILYITTCGLKEGAGDDDDGDGGGGSGGGGPSFVTVVTASCAILYSFEGICLVLPIQNALSPRGLFPPLYAAGISAVAATYFLFSYSTSAALRDHVTSGSITAYLTEAADQLVAPSWAINVVNILLTVSGSERNERERAKQAGASERNERKRANRAGASEPSGSERNERERNEQ
jgi:proton-coupled amino acid transporter